MKVPTHFSISLLKTPSGVPRTTTPTCPQIARPANVTAGRATRRFSSTLRHIFLTMRLLHRNICGMCTTGRKRREAAANRPLRRCGFLYVLYGRKRRLGGCGRADSVSFWKLYGDDSLIRRHYDGMVRYARFMIKRCTQFTPLRHHLPLKGEAKSTLSITGIPTESGRNRWMYSRTIGKISSCLIRRNPRPIRFYHGAYDGNRRVFGKAAG